MEDKIIAAVLAVSALIMIIYYLRKKKPVRHLLFGMSSGLITLIAACLCENYIGCPVAINAVNTATALILGIPGVVMIIILKLISR